MQLLQVGRVRLVGATVEVDQDVQIRHVVLHGLQFLRHSIRVPPQQQASWAHLADLCTCDTGNLIQKLEHSKQHQSYWLAMI